jgi:hypothetical protein
MPSIGKGKSPHQKPKVHFLFSQEKKREIQLHICLLQNRTEVSYKKKIDRFSNEGNSRGE